MMLKRTKKENAPPASDEWLYISGGAFVSDAENIVTVLMSKEEINEIFKTRKGNIPFPSSTR